MSGTAPVGLFAGGAETRLSEGTDMRSAQKTNTEETNPKDVLPIPEIERRLAELSVRLFGDERILRYEHFRIRAFSEIALSDLEYEATEKESILKQLIHELKDLVDQLAVPLSRAADFPLPEILERNTVAAKITYKRALYMVRQEKFCEAAMTTAFAVDYITDAVPVLKDDPATVIEPGRVMALGLLEETLTAYMNPTCYVASDCASNCGYCQDPLSTVAKYCSEALESSGASASITREIWETAAAMLGAYLKSKGGDVRTMRFGAHIPRQASSAYRLMVYNEKVDKEMVLRRVEHYQEKLRVCQINLFVSQYGHETPVIPHDF